MVTFDLDIGGRKVLPLTKVVYARNIIHNLRSLCMVIASKCEVYFKDTNYYVIHNTKTTLVVDINKNLYVVEQFGCANVVLNSNTKSKSIKQHNKFG